MNQNRTVGALLMVAATVAGAVIATVITAVVVDIVPVTQVSGQAQVGPQPRSTVTVTLPGIQAPERPPTDPASPTSTVTVVPPATVVVPAPRTVVVPAPAEPEPELPPVAPPAELDAIEQETALAISVTESYWNDVFTGWDAIWVGPQLWNHDGFYDSELPGGPACGGDPAGSSAFYCNLGGYVAWDWMFMASGYFEFGDSFIHLVVAHEWAHAAQERFRADGEGAAVLDQAELQADCIAGATISGAVDKGYVVIEEDDIAELVLSLQAAGDEHVWTEQGDHGSGDQRVNAFAAGYNGDIESCLGNADGSPPGYEH